jgi:hypothetical protein
MITIPCMWVCLASGGYAGSTRLVSRGSRTLPPARMGAFGPPLLGAGATTVVCTPPITPPLTPPMDSPATAPGTPPTAPPSSKSGGSGASLMSAIFVGTTVAAINFPAFSKTRCTGAAFTAVRGCRRWWRRHQKCGFKLPQVQCVGAIKARQNRTGENHGVHRERDQEIHCLRTALDVIVLNHRGLKEFTGCIVFRFAGTF